MNTGFFKNKNTIIVPVTYEIIFKRMSYGRVAFQISLPEYMYFRWCWTIHVIVEVYENNKSTSDW